MATPVYIDKDYLVSRMGEADLLVLADQHNTEDIDSATVDANIEVSICAAEAEVHAYISRRYPVPFSSPFPELLIELVYDITLWKLSRGPAQEDDGMRMRYKDARKTLENIAAGKVSLGPDDPDAGGGNYVTHTGKRTADRDRARANLDKVY